MDDKKIRSLIGIIKHNLEGLRTAAALLTSPARSAEGRAALAAYGPIRTESARLAASVREASPGDFQGSPATSEGMRARQGRIEILTDAKALFEEAAQLFGSALTAEKETQALEVDETVQVVTHLLQNPLCPKETRDRLSPFGAELLALVESKNADVASRRLGTMALKQEASQAAAENQALKAKVLEGERPRPAELATPPAPAAPAARRRRPR